MTERIKNLIANIGLVLICALLALGALDNLTHWGCYIWERRCW